MAWMWRKGKPLVHYWFGSKLVQSLWKTIWRLLKKPKIELPYDPAVLLVPIYPNETKTLTQKDIFTLTFTAALFTIAKRWKQPKGLSRNEYIERLWCIHTHIHTHWNTINP